MTMRPILALGCAFLVWVGAAPAAAQPEVGDIFDIDPGEQFRGWMLTNSGIRGDDNIPYAVFEKDGEYLVALTQPVARNASGGILVEKITHKLRLRAAPGEVAVDGHDCTFVGVAPAIGFFSEATGIARGFFIFKDEVRAKRWFPDDVEECRYSGD